MASLPASDANIVDATQFISSQQLQAWGSQLDALGLRATGNPAHETYINELVARLQCAGVQNLHTENVPITRWQAQQYSLSYTSGSSTQPVTAAAYVPYSGPTTSQGVTAPSVYLDSNTTPTAANSAGKIVIVDAPTSSEEVAEFTLYAMGLYQLNTRLTETYARPYLALASIDTLLGEVDAAGAAGVILINPAPYSTTRGIYYPYDGVTRSTPGLYVDENVGAQLKTLAASNTPMTLTLTASVDQFNSRNIVGFIPGASTDLTVINSHSDGTNGVEDNGPNAVVGIAQYLARLPTASLPRTIMVVITTGHFTGVTSPGVKSFLSTHANDGILSRIASITTMEHMGTQDWEPDANGDLQYSGKTELGAEFMPEVQALADHSYDWFINAAPGGGAVLKPLTPNADGINTPAWPGEGEYWYALGKLPDINYITGPNYLLNYGITTTDKTDFDRMRSEMVAFGQMQLDLSRASKSSLNMQSSAVVTVGTGKYGPGPGP